MPLPFPLSLRRNGHRVRLVTSGSGREVLGVAYPGGGDRRLRLLEQWGLTRPSPRRRELPSIAQPLPLRSQAILSHRLPPAFQARLAGGSVPLATSRQALQRGEGLSLPLGPHLPPLEVARHTATGPRGPRR